jgi:small subunit ribosomal protein S16
MAVSLRLQRVGKRNQAQYRIVAIDSRKRIDGEPLEILGHYSPGKKTLELNIERYDAWISRGARATETVGALYKRLASKKRVANDIITSITTHA